MTLKFMGAFFDKFNENIYMVDENNSSLVRIFSYEEHYLNQKDRFQLNSIYNLTLPS